MKKIKVLNIITDSNIGGAGKCIITYSNNYDKGKYEIVVAMPENSLLKPEIEKTGVRVIELPGLRDKSLDIPAIKNIRKVIEDEKPDIVHTHASLSARIAARQYEDCKIVYTRHCDFPISKIYKYKIVRWLNKKINESLTDKVIATSEQAKENLIKQGLSENIITTILNGVNKMPEISDEEKKNIKEKYSLKPDEIVVGYLARVEELKGHKYFIEAAKIVSDKFKGKYKFLIMGSGSYEEEAKKLVKELNLEDTVIFTGFIKNVHEMLNVLDIQINASYLSETTCLSLLEGMSLGVPTVATKCGGTPKMIDDYENGLLVEKANSQSLADGIINIMKDKEKYEYMKKRSKEIYEERYTSKIYAQNIEKVYESLVIENEDN
ncbi:MAG: glycosyltransferase [Clostridia bacterium]|nr:glycosyltransferase [Clostridia bacterium]